MQVEYRNCNYIGGFEEYRRQGYGLLILDNSTIIFGTLPLTSAKWNQDKIDGPYAYISDRVYAFGSMSMGKLEGYSVISRKQSPIGRNAEGGTSNSKGQSQRAIFSMFRDDRPYGKFILIKNGQAMLGQYAQGEIQEFNSKRTAYQRDIYDLLQSTFPHKPYKMHHQLEDILAEASKEVYALETQKYVSIIKLYENGLKFYGYSEISKKERNVGIILNQNSDVVTIGEHDGIYLEGLGRAYKIEVIEDGVFKGGALNGIGVRYHCTHHRYELGEYGRGEPFEKGFGFPYRQVSEIRKEFHLRAIQFYNDLVVLPLGNMFEALIQGTIQLINERESPRFTGTKKGEQGNPNNNMRRSRGFSEKSPLKSKIEQYQFESDQMEDPIKQPLNSYDRSEVRPKREPPENHKRFESDDYDDHREDWNPRQREEHNDSQTKKRSNKSFQKREDEERETRSGRRFKNTKELVKQLDEQEQNRRTYLDQIYK